MSTATPSGARQALLDGLLLGRRPAGEAPRTPARVPRGGPLPLSFTQRGLWLLDSLRPGTAEYVVPVGWELTGPLAPAALADALTALAGRHEILRTRYPVTDGEPGQLPLPGAPVELETADLSRVDPAGREAVLAEHAGELARTRFDLASGSPLRARLLRLAADRHVLLLALHHIAFDGWSQGVLARDLGALWTARAEGAPDPLPPLPAQYADHAAAQRAAGADPERLRWWRDRLAGATALELPADHPRPPLFDPAGAIVPFTVPAATAESLTALGRARGATGFMVCFAAFALLLAQHAGRTDITVGTPTAGRDRPGAGDLIGNFVNTLVLRTDLSGRPSFAEAVDRVRATALDAFARQDVPFEALVDALAPPRDLSRNPLFQTMFTLRTAGEEARAAFTGPHGLRATPLDLPWHGAKFDLTLHLTEQADGSLTGKLEYATALFTRPAVDALAEHLTALLTAAARDPHRPVSGADLLPDRERGLLEEWNRTDAPYPADATLHGLVAAQTARTPDAVAVRGEDGTLTYRELHDAADRLAGRLRAAGVGPESIVAVCLERTRALPVALLAVLRAGGAYLPLDPDYPAERLAYMLRDSGAAAVVTDTASASVLPPHEVPVLLSDAPELAEASPVRPDGALDPAYVRGDSGVAADTASAGVLPRRDVPLAPPTPPVGALNPAYEPGDSGVAADTASAGVLPPHHGPAAPPAPPAGPLNPAYVIYTSGSTGRPKGVVSTHRGIVNRLHWMQRAYRLTPDDRVLQKTPYGFDVSVWELFWPLTTGACLVLARPGGQRDPGYLAGAIEQEGITVTHFVPSMLREFLTGLPASAALDTLRLTVCSGEALPDDLAAAFHGHPATAGAALHNLYGPTEAAVDVTAAACRPGERVTLGSPVDNTRVHVMDAELRPSPVGVPGQLCLAGVQLARGYLGRPALTAERFVPDPDPRHPGGRLYLTGDVGRRNPDGTLSYHGRDDQQVKLRGQRVEPGEIEAALRAHPGVADAAVRLEGPAGAEHLAAHVVPADPAAPPGPADLRAHLRLRLPAPMIPTAWAAHDAFPLTPSGKLDRRALPAAEVPAAEQDYAEPAAGAERTVADAWHAVLDRPRIGAHDNFFDLGGHSLLAGRIALRLRETTGRDVPVRALFDHPTVAALAAALPGYPAAAAAPPLLARRRSRTEPAR